MSQSDDLAQKFEQANAAVIAAVEACGEEEWQSTTSEEGWTAAALAHHIAEYHALISGLVTHVGVGSYESTLTAEQLDAMNAARATEFSATSKGTVIDLARQNGAGAASALRAMSESQLAATADFFGQNTTAAELVENLLIGHALTHLQSFKSATAHD